MCDHVNPKNGRRRSFDWKLFDIIAIENIQNLFYNCKLPSEKNKIKKVLTKTVLYFIIVLWRKTKFISESSIKRIYRYFYALRPRVFLQKEIAAQGFLLGGKNMDYRELSKQRITERLRDVMREISRGGENSEKLKRELPILIRLQREYGK